MAAEDPKDSLKIPPVHPGEILKLDVLEPLGMSQNELARALGVNRRRISEIVNERRSVTADTALRLGKYLGMSAQFWLGLQQQYDLDVAEDELEEVLRDLQPREEIYSVGDPMEEA